MGLIEKDSKIYANVISDGSLRIQSTELDEKAVKREWETKDGKSGVKWERVYKGISGDIIDISFHDSDYGKNIHITFEKESENEENITLTLNTASNFAQDFMKKLPNVNLNKKVSLSPYSFDDEKGKNRKGIVVWQDGEKVPSFFYDAEKKKSIHGFPVPEGDTKKYDTDDWKIYFTKVKKFLIKYTEEKIIYNFSVPQEKTVATPDTNDNLANSEDPDEIKHDGPSF